MPARPMLMTALALALVAACSASGGGSTPSGAGSPAPSPSSPPGSPPRPAAGAALDGHAYVSTGIAGRALVPGTVVSLRFAQGQLGANAGCNSMSGAYGVVDGKLDVGAMATTEMACDADRMAQDQWLGSFLPGAAVALEGTTLTLANGGVTMTLVDRETTNRSLEGTYWGVDGLVSGDAVSSVPAGVDAVVHFAGGSVDLRAGCNRGSGTATVTGGRITFGPIALTRMMCGPAAMAVESHVLGVLTGTQPYAISGDTLTIGASGKDGLLLKAGTAPPPSDPGPT